MQGPADFTDSIAIAGSGAVSGHRSHCKHDGLFVRGDERERQLAGSAVFQSDHPASANIDHVSSRCAIEESIAASGRRKTGQCGQLDVRMSSRVPEFKL